MGIVERIADVAGNLTPAEQILVREIVAHPREVALGTASSLAKSSGVHEATASRLAKKLGFASYAEFRDAVRNEFLAKAEPAQRVRNTLDAAPDGDLFSELIAREMEALETLSRYVDNAKIETAARALLEAPRIFIFARGNAETLAVMLERRLLRMGRNVEVLTGDGRSLAERALRLDKGDGLVTFAFRRQPRHFAPLIERAQKVGTVSVAISGSIGPTLSPAPDVLLWAPRSGSQAGFQTLTVPMAITNALILTLARMDQARTLDRLEALGTLISEFDR